MSARPPGRSSPASNPRRIDASPNGALPGPITWAKSLWNRSSNQPVEPDDATKLLIEMRDELRVRLLVHDKAALVARNLFMVHKEMGKNGWDSVAGLPPHVLAGAVADAEALQRQEPTPLMAMFLDRLGQVRAGADQAAAEEHAAGEERAWALTDCAEVPEVSEASHEDYELMERSWIGTVPSGLRGADRERKHVMPYSGVPIEAMEMAAATAEPPTAADAVGSVSTEPGLGEPTSVLPLGNFTLREAGATPPPAPKAPAREPATAQPAQPPAPAPAASRTEVEAGGVDVFVAIEKLATLHAKGILTEAEFAAKKSELLSRV